MTAVKTDENGKVNEITIEAKNGEPVADKHGFVKIVGGNFKGFDTIALDVLKEQFKLGA